MLTAIDIFHLYLGCRVRYTYKDGEIVEFLNESIFNNGTWIFGQNLLWSEDDPFSGHLQDVEIDLTDHDGHMQLFLISTFDLTSEQLKEYKDLCHMNYFKEGNMRWETDTPESLLWLFRNKVDAFDLLENGHAINPTIKQDVIPKILSLSERAGFDKASHILHDVPKKVKKILKAEVECMVCNDTGQVIDRKTGLTRNCVMCKKALYVSVKD